MPRVPKIDELQVGVGSIDTRQINPVQARLTDAGSGGYDLSRLRTQESRPRFDAGAPLQALRFSDEPSRQLIQTGGIIADWADMRREIGIREADEMDRARVTDAQNQYLSAVMDAANNEKTGWKTRQGLAALPNPDKNIGNLEDQVFKGLKQRRADLLASLGNDRQKAAFAEWADQEDLRQRQAIQNHVLRESQTYRANTIASQGQLAGQMIATGDDQEYALGKSRIEETLAQEAHMHGYSPEQIEVRRQELASSYVRAAITRRIQGGDLQGALAMLDQERPYLNAGDYLELKQTWQTAQDHRIVNDVVSELTGGGEADFVAAKVGDPYAVYNQGFVAQTYVAKLVDTESSGNNHARPIDKKTGKLLSSAYGRAQFTDSTWMQFGKSEIGRALRGDMTNAQWLEMRSDKATAEQATLWYAEENKRVMERHGIPFNNLTAYLFHFGGPEGGRKIYQARPDTPLEQILTKGQINANRDLVARTKTTGGLMAYFAKKMDVKPTGEQAPQAAPRISYAHLRETVERDPRFAHRPDLQEKILSGVNRRQNEREADEKAAKDEALLIVNNELVRTNGDLTQVSPEALTRLDPTDRMRIEQSALGVRRHNDALIEANNTVYMLDITRKESLAQLNEADIQREWLDGHISTGQYEQMTKLLRTYQESVERERKGETPSLFDFDKGLYSKTQLYDRIRQWADIDKYGKLEPEQRRQLERIELYAKEEGQRILDASIQAGVPFDMKAYEAALMRIMREAFKTGETGFLGGEKTAPIYQIPIGDVPFTSIMDAAGSLPNAQNYIQPTNESEPYDPFLHGPMW